MSASYELDDYTLEKPGHESGPLLDDYATHFAGRAAVAMRQYGPEGEDYVQQGYVSLLHRQDIDPDRVGGLVRRERRPPRGREWLDGRRLREIRKRMLACASR